MAEEKAIIKKPSGEIAREPHQEGRLYEVIVKFHRDGKELVETFLLANMVSVTISATEDPKILLAYCKFVGEIQALDSKLATLRQSAMVVLGDKEAKFLDFFVALRQLSQPVPRLLSSGRPRTLPDLLNREWVKGFLIAFGLVVMWQGYHFLSSFFSQTLNPSPTKSVALISTVSEWAPYVLPQYHSEWLKVKEKHGLRAETMVSLFRKIKQIDKYSAGNVLKDLTIYPGAIDRALGLIILKGVGDAEALGALLETLGSYHGNNKFLPDIPVMPRAVFQSDDIFFNDSVILNFYEHILKEPHRKFTESLILELQRSHISG